MRILELNQDDKAAQQFEKISAIEKDRATQMAALWQAAQLYQKQNNTPAAARAFSKYANTYKKAFRSKYGSPKIPGRHI